MSTASSAKVLLVRSTWVCDPFTPPYKLDLGIYTRKRIVFYVAQSSIEAPQEEVTLEDFEPPELSNEDAIYHGVQAPRLSRWEGLSVLLQESFISQGWPVASLGLAPPSLPCAPPLSSDEALRGDRRSLTSSRTIMSRR
jgi:hypothetical protein